MATRQFDHTDDGIGLRSVDLWFGGAVGSPQLGQITTRTIIQTLMESDAWKSSALLITYDDWGGWYDHVPPPQVDKYGYGFLVPAMLVSAYARQGNIDHTQLDHTSILKFIEANWGIEPLAQRDA